jgi:hypothetical protein
MEWNGMESWNHGIMESWNHGIMESQNPKKLKWFFAHRGNDSNQAQINVTVHYQVYQ